MTAHVRAPHEGAEIIPLRATREPGDAVAPDRAASVLRAAADAVQAACARSDTIVREKAPSLLEWLVTAVAEAQAGSATDRAGPAANAFGMHLLDLVRMEVLRGWEEADPPARPDEILAQFRAIEQVRLAISPEWSNELASELAGPDGLSLVSGLAHDLRSPLTSILFLAETLGRGKGGQVNLQQLKQLRLIYSAALALNSLASDVIELARGGRQLIEKDTEVFSLAELVEWLRDMVLPVAEEKGIEIRHSLPLTDRREGRPLALSRVLLNLMTNALKFTEQGFVELKAVAKGRDWVEFSVRDTGRGISPDAVATLFEPFSRATSGRHPGVRFSGTGLGLALCRTLVEAMGSELKYETRPEWGTRFYFEIELPPASRL